MVNKYKDIFNYHFINSGLLPKYNIMPTYINKLPKILQSLEILDVIEFAKKRDRGGHKLPVGQHL
jgi:hypothetical protein